MKERITFPGKVVNLMLPCLNSPWYSRTILGPDVSVTSDPNFFLPVP